MALNQQDRETLRIVVGESSLPRRSVSVWSRDGNNEVVAIQPTRKRPRTFLIPLPVSSIIIADHKPKQPPTKPQGTHITVTEDASGVFVNEARVGKYHKFMLSHGVAGRSLQFDLLPHALTR